MKHLHISDQLAVVLTVVLVALVVSAPLIIQAMRTSDNTFEGNITPDDDIMDLINANNNEDAPRLLDALVQDLARSPSLQQAAQEFAIRVLQSPAVQQALSVLVKTLFVDLVNDPATREQVIRLVLQVLQDEQTKQAVIALLQQVVQDPTVQESLQQMVHDLGQSAPVQTATLELLQTAVHDTLNDTDVLDHSLEFASDVVGDDFVQRTAGQALRRTVRHALTVDPWIVWSSVVVGVGMGVAWWYNGGNGTSSASLVRVSTPRRLDIVNSSVSSTLLNRLTEWSLAAGDATVVWTSRILASTWNAMRERGTRILASSSRHWNGSLLLASVDRWIVLWMHRIAWHWERLWQAVQR